jgi:hypothetical protein
MGTGKLLAVALFGLATAAAWPQAVRLEGVTAMLSAPLRRARPGAAAPGPQSEVLLSEGRKRIAAGKATTRFVPSGRGVNAAVAGIAFTDPDDPKTPEAQVRSIRDALRQFNRRMKDVGLAPNDFADGCAMAHALYHQSFFGRRLDAKSIKTNREAIRKLLLKDARFQGMKDFDREAIYDRMVAMSMYAIGCREQSVEAASDDERQALLQRARRNAFDSGLLKLQRGLIRA